MNDLRKLPAAWCRVPAGSQPVRSDCSLFRRSFHLDAPQMLRMLVSADSRCNLYVDGKFCGRGPVRGDLEHYGYRIYEQELPAGNHVISAETIFWSDGFLRPWSEIHYSAAFLLAGECGRENLSTPGFWRCSPDLSRNFREDKPRRPAGATERFTGGITPENWKMPEFDDSAWENPEYLGKPYFPELNTFDPPSRWRLEESTVPEMAAEPVAIKEARSSTVADCSLRNGILYAKIPAGKHKLQLDLGCYYTHLLHLKVLGGTGNAFIRYAECLLTGDLKKGRRDFLENAVFPPECSCDELVFTGGNCSFTPFWFRSGRFAELSFDLADGLELELSFEFLTNPLTLKNPLEFDLPMLNRIADTAWHTLKCCIHEHFEDCPYWEQLQYAGDARIQALITYEATGDDRFGRQAIRQFGSSRNSSGLTLSRYPANFPQIIPEFSLFWILMIRDHFEYFHDPEIIRENWNGIREIIDCFLKHRLEYGLIGPLREWNFSDWVPEWSGGRSNRGTTQPETLLNLIFAETCRQASLMAEAAGKDGAFCAEAADSVLHAVNRNCYSEERGLYADTPEKCWFSQHSNIWAVLAGAADHERSNRILDAVLIDKTLSPCTLYFSFYLLEVLCENGRFEAFLDQLKRWDELLTARFTTFPEIPSPNTRSDCHGWSSGPLYFLLKYRKHLKKENLEHL